MALPWHSEHDLPYRKAMLHDIYAFFQRCPRITQSDEWRQAYPDFLRRLELALYLRANSQEEYADHKTVEARLRELAAVLYAKRLGVLPLQSTPSDTCKTTMHSQQQQPATAAVPQRIGVATAATAGGGHSDGLGAQFLGSHPAAAHGSILQTAGEDDSEIVGFRLINGLVSAPSSAVMTKDGMLTASASSGSGEGSPTVAAATPIAASRGHVVVTDGGELKTAARWLADGGAAAAATAAAAPLIFDTSNGEDGGGGLRVVPVPLRALQVVESAAVSEGQQEQRQLTLAGPVGLTAAGQAHGRGAGAAETQQQRMQVSQETTGGGQSFGNGIGQTLTSEQLGILRQMPVSYVSRSDMGDLERHQLWQLTTTTMPPGPR